MYGSENIMEIFFINPSLLISTISCPSTLMLPFSIGYSKQISLSIVLFPEPLSPTI